MDGEFCFPQQHWAALLAVTQTALPAVTQVLTVNDSFACFSERYSQQRGGFKHRDAWPKPRNIGPDVSLRAPFRRCREPATAQSKRLEKADYKPLRCQPKQQQH